MSLFNRKVLQIGVVANLTLLQKYCILNIGNTLPWKKSGQYVVNIWGGFDCRRHPETDCNFVHITVCANLHILCICISAYYACVQILHIAICEALMIANGENWTIVSDNKSWRSDNLNSKLSKFKFWILKSNKIQIWTKIGFKRVYVKDTKPDWHILLIFKRGGWARNWGGLTAVFWYQSERERELQNDARVVFVWGWLALQFNQDLIGGYFGRLSLSLSKLRSWDRTWNVNFLNGSVIISSWRASTESSHLISFFFHSASYLHIL